jgi:carbon storage regulator
MLVLSRKPNESIVIDGNIVITVLRVEGNKVRLGIQAPSDVTILRQELQPRPRAEPVESTTTGAPS